MASSGSKSYNFTDWDSIVFSWEITSQSVENNTSTIAWKVQLVSTSSGRIDSSVAKMCAVTINGKSSAGTSYIYIGNNATKTLRTGTQVITHNEDGTKTFNFNVNQELNITFSGSSLGYANFSGSGTLDPIPRLSTVSAAKGNLGQAQTLTVSRHSSSFTHTITYKCGSKTGTVCTKSSATSVSFTPPLNLAEENTTGRTVNVTYTVTTYNGDTALSGTKATTVQYTMDSADFTPTVRVNYTDATGYADIYGRPVVTLSKLTFDITVTTKYGASVRSFSARANNTTYGTTAFTTEPLQKDATGNAYNFEVNVTDSRGFLLGHGGTIAVLDYSPPRISKLTVHRCNADGTENAQGEFVKATFSAAVQNINNKNTATYKLRYKKSSDTTYTEAALTAYTNAYTVTDGNYIFPAASEHSYDVQLVATDNHNSATVSTSASTAFTLIHFRADGTGIAFGKISELPDLADFGLPVRFMGGIAPPCLEADTDLNAVRSPGTYTGENVTTYNYANCPVTSGTFTLLVEGCGESGQVKQTYTTCSKYKPEKYSRFYYQGEWGDWWLASTDEVVLYENDSGTNGAIALWASASHYRYFDIYFTDNNGKTGGYTRVYSPNGKNVCLHIQEAGTSIFSRQTMYTISGTTMTPDTTNASYVKFSGTSLAITAGTNYIKIVRVIGRA